LLNNLDLAMAPYPSLRIALTGMIAGKFTGYSLMMIHSSADFTNARKIVHANTEDAGEYTAWANDLLEIINSEICTGVLPNSTTTASND